MADVRPFRGVTYDPARVELGQVLSTPYDVISPTQQAGYLGRDPHNAVRVVLNPAEGEQCYEEAAASLRGWLADGTMRRDEEPGFYLHRHGFELGDGSRVTRVGVLAAVRLEPWESEAVRPHEHTMPGPKEDRLKLARATNADTEPIWLFHPDPASVVRDALARLATGEPTLRTEFVAEPLGDEAVAAETHELWRISERAEVEGLHELLLALHLYIADGHHRYETALARAAEVGGGPDDASRFKLVLVSSMHDEALIVLPTHRMLRLPPGQDFEPMFAQLRLWGWRIEPAADEAELMRRLAEPPALGHISFGLLAQGAYRYLEGIVASTEIELLPSAVADLDVALVHDGILAPYLGVSRDQLASGDIVGYSRDAAEVSRRVTSGEFSAGIFLRPPTLTQVKHVADSGESMPQKSTYFWPKPPSGLVMMLQNPGEPL